MRRDRGAKLRGCDGLCASSVAVGGTENDTAALGGGTGWMQRIAFETSKAGTWRGYGHGEQDDERSACGGCRRCGSSTIAGAENNRGFSCPDGECFAAGGGTCPGGVASCGDFTDGRGEGAGGGSCNRVGAGG